MAIVGVLAGYPAYLGLRALIREWRAWTPEKQAHEQRAFDALPADEKNDEIAKYTF